MSFLSPTDLVQYACSCGSLKPISRIYFCRHCLKMRCGYCVSHEVESHYCANCLENLAPSEARLKKNKCASCFDCPSCFYTASTRSITVTKPNPEDPNKPIARKAYYLFCGFCRWSSRDVGIPDQSVATGGWPERENVNTSRINSLLEYYKSIGFRERIEKNRKKFNPMLNYLHFSGKFGLTVMMVRKQAGLPPSGAISYKDDKLPDLAPSVATEDVEELPPEIFTEPVNLLSVTTLPQRLSQPDLQPELVSQLFPLHKRLLMKRSLRCRSCEHNVSKPEISPISIKFKIQLSAYYHVPEVRFVTCEPLRAGKESEMIIKICNPTQHQTMVQFAVLPTPEEDKEELEREKQEKKNKQAENEDFETGLPRDDVSCLLPSLSRQLSVCEEPRPLEVKLSGDVRLPTCCIILPPRDDAAEYDDPAETQNFQDDPKIVVWRKANKVAMKIGVVPHLTAENDVHVGFLMKYTYVNTMTMLDQKGPQKVDLKVKVLINVGKIFGEH